MVHRGLIAKWTIIMVLSFLIFVVIVFLVKSGGFSERYVLWYLGKPILGKICLLTLLSFSRTFDYRKVLIFSVIFVLHIGQDSSRSAQFSQVARWPQGRKSSLHDHQDRPYKATAVLSSQHLRLFFAFNIEGICSLVIAVDVFR